MHGCSKILLPGKLPVGGSSLSGPELQRLTLSGFYVGPENALVAAAVTPLRNELTAQFSPLVLVGPTGVGKTHLASGLYALWHDRDIPAIYQTAGMFAEGLAAAIDGEHVGAFRQAQRGAHLWILEEIGVLAGKPAAAQQEFLFTLDTLQRRGATVVVTSRVPIAELSGLGPALQARLSAGLTVLLTIPGPEARTEILGELAQALGMDLGESARAWLAARLVRSVPDLAAVLLELKAALPAGNLELAEVRRLFEQGAPRRRQGMVRILGATARHFGLRAEDLKGASRNRTVATARGVAMYLGRKLTDNSLEKIGSYFGRRDHTTVLHNCRKIDKLLQSDPSIRQAVEKLLISCRVLASEERL